MKHHRPLTVPDDRPGYTKRAQWCVDYLMKFKGYPLEIWERISKLRIFGKNGERIY